MGSEGDCDNSRNDKVLNIFMDAYNMINIKYDIVDIYMSKCETIKLLGKS